MDNASSPAAPSFLGRVHDGSSKLLFVAAGLALAAAATLYVFEVTARYAFNAPTTWSGEVVGYALCLVIFLGLPEATRRGAHIAIDIVPSTLTGWKAAALLRTTDALAAAACLAAGLIAGREALNQLSRGLMTNAAHPIPRWWITAVIAAGLLSAALHFLRHALSRHPKGTAAQ
ncbi:MAG: TRAP transporter small permease [Pseudomonadota bacterium]